jgi:hypothetical protein
MWRLRYALEAAGYIADNWGLLNELISAIRSLCAMEHPVPEGATLEMDVYVWSIAEHTVYYTLTSERKIINILVLRPIA